MPPETEDLRTTIDNAINTAEAGSGTPEPSAPAIGGTPTPSGTPPIGYQAPAPAPAPAPGAVQVPAPGAPQVGSIPPKESAPGAPTPPVATPPAGSVLEDKPPGTWTPQARERWKEVHPDVRAEITRRERETSRAMTQSTDARRFKKEFDAAIRPFEGFIAAEKSNAIQATVNMMQTAAMLRTGTASQKANLVANVIKNYQIDLRQLDGLLAGDQPDRTQEHLEQLINQRTQPLVQRLQAFEQRERETMQQLDSEVDSELEAFANDPKNEFYNDVKQLMADILEVDGRRGGSMGLTEAYTAATLLSDSVRLTLEGRKTSQSPAQRGHQIAQQARSGAFSVKPSDETGVATTSPGDSIRDAINFAMEKTSGH